MDIAQQTSRLNGQMLSRLHQRELDQLFNTLPPVRLGSLNGTFRGRLLGISGINALPRFLRGLVYLVLQTPLNPWRGKTFAEGAGSNVWLNLKGQLRFAHYKVESDGETGIDFLNYDIESNWKPLRGIRGEARQLNDQLVLARMNYQLGDKTVRVLYFTLETD